MEIQRKVYIVYGEYSVTGCRPLVLAGKFFVLCCLGQFLLPHFYLTYHVIFFFVCYTFPFTNSESGIFYLNYLNTKEF